VTTVLPVSSRTPASRRGGRIDELQVLRCGQLLAFATAQRRCGVPRRVRTSPNASPRRAFTSACLLTPLDRRSLPPREDPAAGKLPQTSEDEP
jgi:hypothetical protein